MAPSAHLAPYLGPAHIWKVVNGYSFVGWNYDRWLVFCILCSCDFMENIPNWGIKRVHAAMTRTALPDELILRGPHPELHARPAVWSEMTSLFEYMKTVLSEACKTEAERVDRAHKVVYAYWAFRHHPVFKVTSVERDLTSPDLTVGVAEPLEPLPPGSDDGDWAKRVPGVKLHRSARVATEVARGELDAASLLPRQLARTCGASLADDDIGTTCSDADTPRVTAAATDSISATVPDLTLAEVETASHGELIAWLTSRAAIEPYSSDTIAKLRDYTRRLLSEPGGPPPEIKPEHPVLRRLLQANPHLKVLERDKRIYRGEGCFEKAVRLRSHPIGELTDEVKDRFLPFPSTRRRGRRLYEAGAHARKRGEEAWGYALADKVTVQLAQYAPPDEPSEDAYIFRMPVRASMRSKTHEAMVAVTNKRVLPWCSVCSCESGVPCSHQYCLLIVLHKMQSCSSYADFLNSVLKWDPSRAASGQVVWWPLKYNKGKTRPAHPVRMTFDEWDAAHCGPLNHHGSPEHRRIIQELLLWPAFRFGVLAVTARADWGELISPLDCGEMNVAFEEEEVAEALLDDANSTSSGDLSLPPIPTAQPAPAPAPAPAPSPAPAPAPAAARPPAPRPPASPARVNRPSPPKAPRSNVPSPRSRPLRESPYQSPACASGELVRPSPLAKRPARGRRPPRRLSDLYDS